jgi:hypothetical protein
MISNGPDCIGSCTSSAVLMTDGGSLGPSAALVGGFGCNIAVRKPCSGVGLDATGSARAVTRAAAPCVSSNTNGSSSAMMIEELSDAADGRGSLLR